ncbi:MAG: SDR family oxidoreductase [Pyrinomonadaceae bacterium]
MPAQQGSRGFSERVAVVSDGANPFGRAVALQLAMQGCYVVVGFADSSPESVRTLVELQSIGTLASAVHADISTIQGVTDLFEQVESMYGRLDLLVNTAQFQTKIDFSSIDENDFVEFINHNLKSVIFCSQTALRLMKNRPNAAIVNLANETGDQSDALFVMAQTALVGLTKSLAKFLAAKLGPKIRVNCVSFQSDQKPVSEYESLHSEYVVAPNDVARAVVYLLSPDAEAITGQMISVGPKRTKI